jgi:hypothetical protein
MTHNIADLMPSDTPDYMFPAWIGCVHFAIGNDAIVKQFRNDTGMTWEPGASGLDQMIDDATDAPWKFVKEFVEWVNLNLWGKLDGDLNDCD